MNICDIFLGNKSIIRGDEYMSLKLDCSCEWC